MKSGPTARGADGPRTEVTFDVSLKLLAKVRPPLGSKQKQAGGKSDKAKMNGSN